MLILGTLWILLAAIIIAVQLTTPSSIKLEWETETEFNTAGFNILRSEDGKGNYTQINKRMIPSMADPASGATYAYVDENIEPGEIYHYQLEDVEFDNTSTRHEMFSAEAPGKPLWLMIVAVVAATFGIVVIGGVFLSKDG